MSIQRTGQQRQAQQGKDILPGNQTIHKSAGLVLRFSRTRDNNWYSIHHYEKDNENDDAHRAERTTMAGSWLTDQSLSLSLSQNQPLAYFRLHVLEWQGR